MGRIKQKRPTDARTTSGGASDLYFRTATSTGTMTVPNLSSTTLLTAPTISSTVAITALQVKRTGITQSTAGSATFSARGVIELGTSSTTAAANWILTVPTAGEEIICVVKQHGSTFGVTVNASTATLVTFGAVTATTAQIRIALPGALGNYFQAVALSSAQWLVTSQNGAVFSTAAA